MINPKPVRDHLEGGTLIGEFDPARSQLWLPHRDPGVGAGFKLHPVELARRRKRCAPVVAAVVERLREFVPCCNVCHSEHSAIIAHEDRYGLPSRTAMCLACGLFYQVDRLSETECSRFYGSGEYRTLVSKFTGTETGIGQIGTDQIQYARGLIRALAGHLQFPAGARLLDVGGSAGHVALEFQKFFGLAGTVLDPAKSEVAAARSLGLESICASFEEWEVDAEYDLVLLCRSIEHVRDLQRVLTKIRRCLSPNGYAYCDFVDFTELCRMVGAPEAVTKIDHCFWLTQESAASIFRSLGLEVVAVNLSPQPPLVGFLVKRCKPSPLLVPDPAWIQLELRNLLRFNSEWYLSGQTPYDAKERMRRKAYLVKRRIQKMFSSRG